MIHRISSSFLSNISKYTKTATYFFSSLSHIDALSNKPQMVDVHEKIPTYRQATASGKVLFPPSILPQILERASSPPHTDLSSSDQNSKLAFEVQTKKGPLLATAIIGGTQGAKLTSNLIPFCHPLMLEKINVSIVLNEEDAYFQIKSSVCFLLFAFCFFFFVITAFYEL